MQLTFMALQLISLVLYFFLPSPWGVTVLLIAVITGFILAAGVWFWTRRTALTSPLQQPFIAQPSQHLFSQVFNDLPTRVYWRDTELNLLGGNQAFCRDMGVTAEQLKNSADQQIERLANNETLLHRDQQTQKNRQPSCNEEIKLQLADGEHYVEHSSVPLYDENKNLIGILGSYYDISSVKLVADQMEKAKETAEQANLAKGEFLANMSHEIRTPINAIVGMANLCLKTQLDQKQKRYLRVIDSSSQALLGVINDILDFSKIDAGKLTIERIPFDLQDVLTSLADMFAYKAYDKDLEFIINLPANIPVRLLGDPLRLNQVLVNLVSNAIKFTEDGEINVAVTLLEKSSSQVWLRISVTDTGIGMDEEQRANLFQAFTQADTSTTRKYGGTGLGLAISRRLIHLMQGDIGVTSGVGQGSTFYIELAMPLQQEQDDSHHQYLMQKLEGVKVLAIDDNLSTREMIQEMLRSYRVDVRVCRTAEQALELYQQSLDEDSPYQLLLVDWRLPGMDGLSLCQKVQQRYGEQAPKLVLATGYYVEELNEKAKQAGVADILSKPYTAATLGRSLSATLFPATHVDSDNSQRAVTVPDSILYAPVLVVEDNEINQQVARELLSSHQFKVDIAEHGQAALDAIERKHYAIVLMDIQMPVMDGITAAKRLRVHYNYQQLPILAMTANAMSGDEERSLAAGMQGHIAKPVDEQQLLKAMVKWCVPGDYQKHPAEETEKVPETQRANTEGNVKYPQTKGIDFAGALTRLGNNVELYLKLVEQLHEQYQNSAMKVSDFITRGQHESARRYFHSLKGAAGNLGLELLQAKAAELEQFMADGNIDKVADQITVLEKRLQHAYQAASDLDAMQNH